MARRLPSRILRHRARVAALVPGAQPEAPDDEVWVEGEPSEAGVDEVVAEEEAGEFAAILFLPEPGAEQVAQTSWRPRTVVRPTLLYNVVAGVAMPEKDVELLVLAPDLAGFVGAGDEAGWTRWQVDGDPQPFGPPGGPVVGVQAVLKQVRD